MAKSTAVVAKKGIKSPTLASPALHPPYLEMIADAIMALKERNGSSQQAIAKIMDEKHKKNLPPNFKKVLSVQLKKFVKSEKLYKVKNSYRISPTEKTKKEKDPKPKLKSAEKIPVKKFKDGGKKVAKKTKRLSQVKTPEALKRRKPMDSSSKSKAYKKTRK